MTQVGAAPWLVIGWIAVAVGVCSALLIGVDIARGHRQSMAVMNWVYPITALYWGPVAVYLYFRRGRQFPRHRSEAAGIENRRDPPGFWPFARNNWWPISKGVSHCGAGCTLGDICGEWLVYLTGWTIAVFDNPAANSLMAMYAADFALAWTFGVVFQYFSIVPMRDDISQRQGVWAAIKADTLSIVAFQVGLFGFMALYHLVLWKPPLTVASPTYWFMMQIGMIIGFFTAWPVNAWLLQRGWKERM